MAAPEFPQHISNDGREVWDWASKLFAHVHKLHEIRTINSDLARIGKTCGDCDKWMKSRECPREWNDRGQQRGPSSGDPRCVQYRETKDCAERRLMLSEKLAGLTAQDQPVTQEHKEGE